MQAVDECDAPMVSLPGGEPLMHPEIDRIVDGAGRAQEVRLPLHQRAAARGEARPLHAVEVPELQRPPRRSRKPSTTTRCAATAPTRRRCARSRRRWRAASASPPTRRSSTAPIRSGPRDFFDTAMRLGVEGMMVSPGYSYATAPDQEHFLAREATREFFRRVFRSPERRKNWRFNQSPLFLEFLVGAREHDCTPWGMPSRGVFGWQKPCYLLQEGYAEHLPASCSTTRTGIASARRAATRSARTAWCTAASRRAPSKRASRRGAASSRWRARRSSVRSVPAPSGSRRDGCAAACAARRRRRRPARRSTRRPSRCAPRSATAAT